MTILISPTDYISAKFVLGNKQEYTDNKHYFKEWYLTRFQRVSKVSSYVFQDERNCF
jgi:hypothetical protein